MTATSGAMGTACSTKAQRHERKDETAPPHTNPSAVPTGIAAKKMASHVPRFAGGAWSSMYGGTTVWKDASPTPLSTRATTSTQKCGAAPESSTATHHTASPTAMSLKGS